ncbi:hypothetical protein [Caulobacter sp. FWC2]|nr:hypothetical protein [Caulobacter sp. FWC2]
MASHEGGCQCGRVRYAVDVELDGLILRSRRRRVKAKGWSMSSI